VACVALLAVLAGCGAAGTAATGTRPAPAAATPSAGRSPASPAAPGCNPAASSLRPPPGPPRVTAGSFMARISARGYLIAGVDLATYHFGYLNPLDGQIEGFDIDMVKAIATAIFGSPGKVKYKAITDAQRIPDLMNGTVDIVAHTFAINCARLQQVDFSTAYLHAHDRLLVVKPPAGPAPDLPALGREHQKVCATTGSDSLPRIARYHAVPVAVKYWTDCLALLQQGQVAGILTADNILAGLAAQDPNTVITGPALSDEPAGLGISRQHPDFVRFVNAVLARLRSDGQWAASYAHWIGTPVPAPPAAGYAN
jgi:polar amino acid transport system substrate-binding protein